MPDNTLTCRSCGGTGKMLGNPDAVSWCGVCGGQGWVPRGRVGGSRSRPAPSGLAFVLGLLFLLTLVAVPFVALVIVLDWFKVLVAPVRSLLEAVPGSAVVTAPGGQGEPLTVTLATALLLVVVLITVSVVHWRAVRSSSSRAGDWKARGIGWVFALILVIALPLLLTVYAVASGADLEQEIPPPGLTHWGFFVGVAVLVLLVGFLFTGRRFVKNADRVWRREVSAPGHHQDPR
ncbi:hypothetical protein [Actinotalea sp. K2]|uniref:hypothetical protein n=1 Tax=Actinotalea sp. K2 TaxID=2939438 RepID=UPI0020179C8E|nr:hypothetical protein [Actinotalea sp. K2]MCL3861023.1 hypothetical protein [Actinotalea sp. K2]